MDNVVLLEELLGLLRTLNEVKGVPGESLEDKNILQNDNADPNKRISSTLSSNERKRTSEIASLFAKTFFEYKKKTTKDTALKTSVGKITPTIARGGKPIAPPPSNKPGSMLMGLLALMGGAGALLLGLINDGPFKGALKILSKIGISGGIKILTSGAKAFIGTLSKFITAPFKTVGKMFKGGILGKMLSFMKPLAKVLKKIPLIGSIISIGFAISRFKSGDTIGGVIDVLSALTGLLNLIPGGTFVAVPLSIGLDVLNAWMDAKTASAENKQEAKANILKDMVGSIGKWIMDNAMYLPIIGGIRRWGMSYDAFKSGNIGEGIKQLGYGILAFVGGEGLAKGFEMLMGFFGGEKQQEKTLSPDNSWSSRLKDWIKKKLKDLPYFLRKPLEWFGIIDEKGDTVISWEGIKNSVGGSFEKIKNFSSGLWDGIWNNLSYGYDWITNGLSNGVEKIKNFSGELWDGIWNTFSSGFEWVKEKIGNMVEPVKNFFGYIADSFGSIIEKTKTYIKQFGDKIVGWVKNLWPFGDDKKELSDEEKSERAKQAGYKSWDEYEKSGWKWKGSSPEPIENVVATQMPKEISVINPNNTESVEKLAELAQKQLQTMQDIRSVTIDILKQIKNGIGGSSNIVSIPQQNSTSPPTRSQLMMDTNRGDYSNSPYALA